MSDKIYVESIHNHIRPLKWTNLEELEKNFKVSVSILSPNYDSTGTGLLQRIYHEGKTKLSQGNQEASYALFWNFFKLGSPKRFQEDNVTAGQVLYAKEIIEKLKLDLHRRYKARQGFKGQPESQSKLEESMKAVDNFLEVTKEADKTLEELIKLCDEMKLEDVQRNGKKVVGKNDKQEKNFPEELNCPICMDIFKSEIFLCTNGHSICALCSSKLTNCPECRVSYAGVGGKVRNRALERLMITFHRHGNQNPVSEESRKGKTVKDRLKQNEKALMLINKRLEKANKNMAQCHNAWKSKHLEDTTFVHRVRGNIGSEANKQYGVFGSGTNEKTFWNSALQSVNKCSP